MIISPLLLHICLLGTILKSCSSFSLGQLTTVRTAGVALHAEPSPFQAGAVVPTNGDDVNHWLVEKGFKFDSYKRRFDFDGKWVRDASQSEGVLAYLQAHGLTEEDAKVQSERPYTQRFEREQVTSNGIVFRVIIDEGRRNTTYELGEWLETVPENFNSAIFVDGSQLKRRTYWNKAQHITETTTEDGSVDMTCRYLKESNLVVERTYKNSAAETTLVCTEIFVPSYDWGDSSASLSSTLKRVPGCMANVEVKTTLIPSDNKEEYRVNLDGEADALVSRGILALFSQVVSQMTAQDVLSLDASKVADQLELRQTLSTGRNDGLASLTRTVQSQIQSLLSDDVEDETVESTTAVEVAQGTKPTVAVLLSGGVDSSVALNLLKRQGYDITAFYLKIWLEDELAHLGKCPWEDDYRICEEICEQAGVPLEAISLQEQYKDRVIGYTVHAAERGRTPNPDIMCNSRVKFGCFYEEIDGRGFDYVASGHYAQLVVDEETGLKKLMRAPDPIKDQSYFLCALTQEQLQKVIFPIGHFQKSEVRELAEEFDLPNKNRPDSQGLCFLGKVKFDEFLGAYLGERPGKILDAATQEQIGRHKGVWYHTVGQRKGIGKVLDPQATSKGPWYVVSKDPSRDIVYVSNEYEEDIFTAARTKVFIEDIHWINGAPPSQLIDDDGGFQPGRFQMKIRHGPRIVEGSLELESNDSGRVILDKKDGGLAPGQYVVLYKEDEPECLGAGVISEQHWAKFLSDRSEVDAALTV